VLRFAKLELVRNQWRRFNYELDTAGQFKLIPDNTPTTFNQLAVNVEENNSRSPVPYKTPPGVVRQQQLSNNNVNVLLNEQSLSIQTCNLEKNKVRGVFKTLNLDLRQYAKLYMYTHIESSGAFDNLQDNEMYTVVRIGNDLINNYYEIRIPLKRTVWGATSESDIWPAQNDLELNLQDLIQLKIQRNNSVTTSDYFKQVAADGKEYAILGNPNLGEVRVIFLGVENRTRDNACTEVWFNELRLGGLDESGGWAALGRVDMKLADLGTLYVSGSARSAGFGTIEQRVNERSREDFTQFDVATNLELGRLLPQKAGMSIPVYASVSKTVAAPKYDPYDLDIKLKDKLNGTPSNLRDSIREQAVDVRTIKTVNFTNVKRNSTSGKKPQIWSIENVDVSYSYYKEEQHSPLIENNSITRHRAGLGYNYTSTPKYIEPLKKTIKSRSPWFNIVKDINFNPTPSLLGFRADVNRQFGAYRPRNVGGAKLGLPETYDKYFTFDRIYNLRWDLTRSLNLDFTATNKSWIDEDTGRLDKADKKRVWDNFMKGGRTVLYTQTANASYVLPTAKVPFLEWTSVRVNYVATYNWLAASLIARNLGNTLANEQQKNATAEFDFTRLYNKSRLLRAIEESAPAAAANAGAAPKDTASKKKKRDKSEPIVLGAGWKAFGRVLTSLKRISVNYTENATATIYGYTDSTHILGMDFKSNAPGFGFIFGRQPDTTFINKLARKGIITGDPNFNFQNRQDYNQKITINAQLAPVRDLTIDLTVDKTFGKTYTELFKDTTPNGYSGQFARLNPYSEGNFSVSYISFQTLFEKIKPNEVSQTFLKFQDYRRIISERLGKANAYGSGQQTSDGYYAGYGRYSQEVLVPAFLAAYTDKDPMKVALMKNANPKINSNPFSGILPRPNWRITYNGLSRIPGLEKIFTSFTVTHGYTSTLSMNRFESALLFQDPFRINYPEFIDTLTGNFIPYFLLPNITINEQFAPMIDLDMQFTNQLNARFEFKKSRTLSLSLVDFQLSEARSTEFTIGAGFRQRGAFSFIKWKGKAVTNDVAFRLDLGLRDDATANSRLDQLQALPTAGQKVVTINPSIDYVVSNRVNLKFYFEQRRVEPKISTAPPITNTRAGVEIRLALTQ
jgi:cell surface protein SprA